jgi:hypothetical protein
MNALAAWTVRMSDGNVGAGPVGFFFSLIVLNGRSVTADPQLIDPQSFAATGDFPTPRTTGPA